jgi:spermidine synthase
MTLDRALTGDGGELVLSARGEEYSIRVDGQDLMNSRSHGSEEKLAVHGCAGLRGRAGARVLIGGLGMGFTVRAALDVLGPDAHIDVAELIPAVVRWNRETLGHLAGAPLADPRTRVIEGDVAAAIARAADREDLRYDAILLDVDNGPSPITSVHNKRLYALPGLEIAMRALRPGGVLSVWSAYDDARFTSRLRQVGFEAETKRVLAGGTHGGRHVLWLARRASDRTARKRQAR